MARNPRKMFPAVKNVGSAYAARRGLRPGACGPMKRSFNVRLAIHSLSLSQHGCSGGHAHSCLDGDLPFGAEEDVDARAELDEAHSLALSNVVAGVFIEDDAARDQSRDLSEPHRRVSGLDG